MQNRSVEKEMREVLSARVTVPVRFSEVDSMGLVWHGHFIKFFEDGREAFGKEFGMGYLDIYRKGGFALPVVDVDCQYKKPVMYEDSVIVEVALLDNAGAKVQYNYRVYRHSDSVLAATGSSTQVFMDPQSGELCLTVPDFYLQWKREQGLLDAG